MNEKRIRLIYGILLSAVLVAAAVCLIAGCLNIYYSAGEEQTYTPEKVADAFAPIAVVVYLAIALTLAGFLLHFILPAQKLRVKMGKNETLILKRLHEKQDYSRCGDAKIRCAIEKEQRSRKRDLVIGSGLLVLGSLVFLWYSLNPERYASDDITGIMVNAMWVLLPCMAVPFGFAVWSVFRAKRSTRQEIKLMRLVAAPRTETGEKPVKSASFVKTLRIVLLCVAVGFIVGGFFFDGWKDVLTKAVNICTECVGLG